MQNSTIPNIIDIPEKTSEFIKNYITNFESSNIYKQIVEGEAYYKSKNTAIMNRKKLLYCEDETGNPQAIQDPYKANYRLASAYLKMLIDQKINYLLSKPISIEQNIENEFENTIGNGFQKLIKQAGKEASKKARAFVHCYIEPGGLFKTMLIPSEQLIPIYNEADNNILEMMIRYYPITVLNESNETITINRVEIWDSEKVTYYQENVNTKGYDLLDNEQMSTIFGKLYTNPRYHFQKNVKYGTESKKIEGLSWNKVPFVPIYNNDEELNDLNPVKKYIDAYDVVMSDFVNNLEDFQDVYWVLKGYGGENLKEFLQQVKAFKTLKTSEDGDAKAETIDIPYEAKKEAMQALENDIFKFGMGFNPSQVGDGNITNVVIQSRFELLDLKANEFEEECKDFINQLLYFVNRYREIDNKSAIEINEIKFDRSMLINEKDNAETESIKLKANAEQTGNISNQTKLEHNPWVKDWEEEIKRIKEEEPKDIIPDRETIIEGDNNVN